MGANMALLPEFIGVWYIIFVAISFFPLFFQFRFSRNIKKAISNNDAVYLLSAFENLKAHYKFIGILCCSFHSSMVWS
jgi:hypothetical protein